MGPDQENTSRVLGMLSAFLGALVLFGWHLRIPPLIQIHSTFVPMQYNTALGFLLCGIGLIAIKFPSRIPCGILGSTASLIGGLTLIQYLFGLSFGLDELFMEHYVLVKTSHPGRMAPNTALCFTLTGTSLALYGFFKRPEKSIPILEVLGAIVAALGLVSFIGYLFNLEAAFGWGKMTRMAVHTSLGFIALGSALVFISKTRSKNDITPPFPTFLTIGLVTISISMWNALEVEKTKEVKNLISLEYENIKKIISNNINKDKLAINRMVARWEKGDYLKKESWQADARNYVTHIPGLLMIAWVTPDFIVNQVVPLEYEEKFKNIDLSAWGLQKHALLKARQIERISSAEPIKVLQEKSSFNLFAPLLLKGELEGFIMCVFDGAKLIESVLPKKNVIIADASISDSYTRESTMPSIFPTNENEWTVQNTIQIENLSFKHRIKFTKDFLGMELTVLPEVIGISGLLLTFFCSTAFYFGQKSRFQARSLREEITERNKAEKQIRVLSQAVEQSPAAVLITDTKGNIEYVSPSFMRLTGYTFEEVKGKNPRFLKSMDTPPEVYVELWNTIKAGKEWHGEIKNIKKNGESFWELASISPIKDQNGTITHFVGIKEDITERKDREKQLLESEMRFRTLVNQAVDSIYLHDHEGKFIQVNTKACESLDYSMDELLKAKISDIEKGVPFEELKQLWSKMSMGQTVILEGVHEKKDGTQFPVEIHWGMINFHERDYFIAFARDISKRKMAEEAVKFAQQQVFISQKMAGIGELAAGVSHEVLNPLNIISIHMQMLSREFNADPEMVKRVGKIQHEIQRIEKILRAMLNLSRQTEKKSESIDIEEELSTVCTIVEKDFETANIHIERNFCGNSGGIYCDKDEMRQVFLNLINNAKQAMPEGGVLSLTTRNVDINNAPYTELAVSDTGMGIKKENLDKIFDPFYTTKDEGKGTGLGLSICHKIIEKSEGSIRVESEEGKYTTFVINLPQDTVLKIRRKTLQS